MSEHAEAEAEQRREPIRTLTYQVPSRVVPPELELGVYANNVDALETTFEAVVDFSRIYAKSWPSAVGPSDELVGPSADPTEVKQVVVARISIAVPMFRAFVANYVAARPALLEEIIATAEKLHSAPKSEEPNE